MRILLITLIDVETCLNQRTHHLIDYLASRGDEVTVLKRMAMREVEGVWRKLFITARIRVNRNVRYIALKPLVPLLLVRRWHAFAMAVSFMIWSRHRYDLCITEAPYPGGVGVWLRRFGRIKRLVYEDLDFFEGFDETNPKRRRETRRLERMSLAGSDLIVSVGYELQRLRKSQTKKEVVVVPNGVNYDLFAASAAQPRPTDRFDLIYIGSLEEWAGVDLAIQAMQDLVKSIPNIKLLILGSVLGAGHHDETLMAMARKTGVEDRVLFLGKKDYHELPAYLAQAHIGVATFKPNDLMKYAFTLKVIEYMAAGLPVIATRVGETERVLMEAKAGMTIAYDVKEFVEAVITVYNDRSLMAKFAKNGNTYAKYYDWMHLFSIEMDKIDKIT